MGEKQRSRTPATPLSGCRRGRGRGRGEASFQTEILNLNHKKRREKAVRSPAVAALGGGSPMELEPKLKKELEKRIGMKAREVKAALILFLKTPTDVTC